MTVCVTVCAEALTTPVIHEHHAKDVLLGFLDGNGLPKLSLSSNKEGLIREKKKVTKLLLLLNIREINRDVLLRSFSWVTEKLN